MKISPRRILIATLLVSAGVQAAPRLSPEESLNDFGLNVVRKIAADPTLSEKGVFVSPLSLHLALSMTAAGAQGPTREQFVRLLGGETFFTTDWYAKTRASLEERAGYSQATLSLNNRLYPHSGDGFKLLAPFNALLKDFFAASARSLDYVGQTEASRLAINADVAADTHGMIRDLLPPSSLEKRTRLVLTNALYFKAAWKNEFLEQFSAPAPFWTTASDKISLVAMNTQDNLSYVKRKTYAAVEIPYRSGFFSLLVLVPDAKDGAQALARTLDAREISAAREAMSSEMVKLSLPKFRSEWGSTDLADVLKSLGLSEAFKEREADFSKISGAPKGSDEALFVSKVFHKAKIEVDEKGSEAAAATAVVMAMAGSAAPKPRVPVVFKADRPFFYAIIDTNSGLMLFSGIFRGK